jgi:hypothetical protein
MGVPSCCIWQDRFQVGGTSFVEAKPEASEVQPTTWAPQCSSHPRRLATVEPKGHDVIEQQNTDAWFDDAGEVRLSQYTDRGVGLCVGHFVGLVSIEESVAVQFDGQDEGGGSRQSVVFRGIHLYDGNHQRRNRDGSCRVGLGSRPLGELPRHLLLLRPRNRDGL